MSVHIIAEAGVNHDGDVGQALALIDAAADAGADAVKFQTFRASELVVANTRKAAYQAALTPADEDQRTMLRRLELNADDHNLLMDHCAKRGIAFLSTPFDIPSLRFLVDELGVERLKLSSGALTDGPLLLEAGRSGLSILLSTGMGTLEDVERALGVLAFGYVGDSREPSLTGFAEAFAAPVGRRNLVEKVTLLHCTTEYPAPPAEANLRAMGTMARAFGLQTGFSDHTAGIHVALAAVALGAGVLEKHLTLDRSLPGPDHQASLEPQQFKELVDAARNIELAMGDGVKRPMPSEIANAAVVRKSLVATRPIRRGEVFTAQNLAARRPGNGLSAMRYWELLGRIAPRDLAEGEVVDLGDPSGSDARKGGHR